MLFYRTYDRVKSGIFDQIGALGLERGCVDLLIVFPRIILILCRFPLIRSGMDNKKVIDIVWITIQCSVDNCSI